MSTLGDIVRQAEMERVKRMIVEYNDPMTGTKRMDTFTNCSRTLVNGLLNVEDEKTITSYLVSNVVKITCEKFEREKESGNIHGILLRE